MLCAPPTFRHTALPELLRSQEANQTKKQKNGTYFKGRKPFMWRCPKCNENIEDQFDSCWKCATSEGREPASDDSFIVWLNPAISLLAAIAFTFFSGFFWHQKREESGYFGLGGALFGMLMS